MSEQYEPKTLSVPEAGKRYFDLGRAASYRAVARGEIPAIKIGASLRVPIRAMERMLERASAPWTEGFVPDPR